MSIFFIIIYIISFFVCFFFFVFFFFYLLCVFFFFFFQAEDGIRDRTVTGVQTCALPISLAHGAPLRLLAPMKLGLKNIKAITAIAYSTAEPADYWNERGYSRYDGL